MITTNCVLCGEIADCNADEVCDECADLLDSDDVPDFAEEWQDEDNYRDLDYDDEP